MTTLLEGDCREVLKTLPDNSVDSIVTDPPYGLGFMGKSWDSTGIAYGPIVWTQCLRVLKPGGHLLSFGGTRTHHRMVCAIEDVGFEIRDEVLWIYGSGFPKSLNIGNGWGTALKPAHEPICLARKPIEGTVANNALKWGVGGINVDGGKIPFASDADERESKEKNRHADFGTAPGGNSIYGDYSMVERTNYNPPARWPANVITDGSEEVVKMFPQTKGGTWNRTAGARPFNNDGKPTDYQTNGSDDTIGSACRFFYSAKASGEDRNEGLEGFEERPTGAMDGNSGRSGQRTAGDGITLIKQPIHANNHPTVKPVDLMCYLCRLITPKGGTVLDPFMGSGSTGKAAQMEGFNFIGIELDPEYMKIARARIGYADNLFTPKEAKV